MLHAMIAIYNTLKGILQFLIFLRSNSVALGRGLKGSKAVALCGNYAQPGYFL
jgi:hypothetical protein